MFDKEYRIVRPNDNTIRWIHGLGRLELDGYGNPQKILGTVQDVTDHKNIDQKLRIAATAFESQEGIIITDANGTILQVNKAFCNITGYIPEEVIGNNPRILQSGRQDAHFYKLMWSSILNKGFWEGEVWNKRKNGEIYPEHLMITAVKNAKEVTTNYVGTITDITLSREAADEIRHLAYYDLLTRLPNRRLLQDRLKQALVASARSGRQGALLFLDLDDFKTLNDTLGHGIGDMLLEQVAQRLESCVREGDTVARLGGDEFVVMLENLSDKAPEAARQLEIIAQKILSNLNQPYSIAQHRCHSTTSIGATLFNALDQDYEILLKQADIAMYQAKKMGRNRLCFFDQSMQDTVNAHALLESDLRKALDTHQLLLYFQIQVDQSNRPLGAETLIRWMHPDQGLIYPSDFIPLAEESGLIFAIGEWVLDEACSQINRWQHDELTQNLILSVNVSAKQFRQSDFADRVETALERHAIRPSQIKLELTESMLLENIESVIATMTRLKKLGVLFSLDDFGTGYSSLQYLKRLPIDELKIDQSFVHDISTDTNSMAIIGAIIAIAHSLNLDVIAEGVETEKQLEQLLKKGCVHYQGFLFSKPVPIGQYEALLRHR
ncbi:MAG: EAL domain-containing protein [Ferrovum sp.]|nr:EAL domain-containing protein [Ferrovum sp.]